MKTVDILKQYNETRRARLALDQESAKLKVKEDELLDQLAGARSGTYGPFHLEVSTKQVPRCTDWKTFYEYIIANGCPELLHKRLTETAILERHKNGEYLPGLMFDDKPVYKITVA